MKAIVQVDISLDKYNMDKKKSRVIGRQDKVVELSKQRFAEYAKKYGHDHHVITEPRLGYQHPVWERLDFWFNPNWFEKYDEILYVDTDVFPTDNAPDIFEHGKGLKCYCRIPHFKAKRERNGIFLDVDADTYRNTLFNAGVILINKELVDKTKGIVQKYREERFTDDSVLLNYAIMNSDIPVEQINKKFNVKMDKRCPTAWFYHLSGRKKSNQDKMLGWLTDRLKD